MAEYTTKDEAEHQAQTIRDYWAARGKKPEVMVIPMVLPENVRRRLRSVSSILYRVHSNMVNGMPL